MKRFICAALAAAVVLIVCPVFAGLRMHVGTAGVSLTLGNPPITNQSFTASAPNGTVGILNATVSDGSTPTWTILGTNSGGFHIINGNTLVESAAGTACNTYTDLRAQATSPTAINSAQYVALTLTCNVAMAQTIIPMVQPLSVGTAFQFLAGPGSANTSIGNIVPAVLFPASPSFIGSWAITGGADANKFKINSSTGVVSVCNTAPSCTDLPNTTTTYNINVTLTQAGVTGSPAVSPVVLQGVATTDTTTLFVALDNYNPAPGSTIHATVRNTPNASGLDYLYIGIDYPSAYNNSTDPIYQPYVGSANTHNATVALAVPSPPTDNYQFLNVRLIPNNSQPSAATYLTPSMVVPPTLSPTVPTAANTLTAPFTPNQIVTACPSGCQYPSLSQAIIGVSNGNHTGGSSVGTVNITDNVLITIGSGTYNDCIQFGNSSPFTPPTDDRAWHLPQHLWVQGVGASMPRIEGLKTTICQGKGLIVFWGTPGTDILYLDNLEMADVPPRAPSGIIYAAIGSIIMRNLYLHDGEMCIITADSTTDNFALQNVHLARCGDNIGPSHNAYFGGIHQLDVDHTVSDQAQKGHELKTRAAITNFTCNKFRGSQDPYYVDSEELDCPEGRECHIHNNTFVKGPGSTQNNQIGWAMDVELGHPVSGVNWQLDLQNNIIIDDELATHYFVYIGPYNGGMGGLPSFMTNPPNVWSNNIFVGGSQAADPFGTYPFLSWKEAATPTGYPDPAQVTEVNDHQFATRAAAGITDAFPDPPGCSGPYGNMAMPGSAVAPTLILDATSFNPQSPSLANTAPLGTAVATVSPRWSNSAPFTGSLSFTTPNGNASNRFSLSGSQVIVNPAGPGLGGDGNTTQNITIQAVQ